MKFTKEDWIDAKFALEWEEDKSSEINKFFKDCNSNNTEVKARFKYYVATTSVTNGAGFYVGRSHTNLPIVKIDELIVNNTKHIIGYKLKEEYECYRPAALKISNTVVNWENSLMKYDISISQKGYLIRLREAEVLDLWFEPIYQEEYKFKAGDYVYWSGIKPTFGIIEKIGEYNYHSLKNTSVDEGSYVSCHEKHLKIITKEEYELGYAKAKYPKGTRFKSAYSGDICEITGEIRRSVDNHGLVNDGNFVLCEGKWAEIITVPDIIINGYKAEFFPEYLRFGCAEIPMQVFKDLHYTCCVGHPTKLYIQGNKSIESVTIGAGKFNKEQIKEIAQYYTLWQK